MSTPLFASKTKAVSFFPAFHCFIIPIESLLIPSHLQLIKMSKEVLRSAVSSRCSAAVIADTAAFAPPPASPSKLKATAGGSAGAADAPPPRPPHLPPCNGGTLLRLHLAQLTSAFLQVRLYTCPLRMPCHLFFYYFLMLLLQPFQPYLNTVATPGLPLPVLLPFRPSNFLQVPNSNRNLVKVATFNFSCFLQSLCADSLHSQFKASAAPPHPPTLPPFMTLPFSLRKRASQQFQHSTSAFWQLPISAAGFFSGAVLFSRYRIPPFRPTCNLHFAKLRCAPFLPDVACTRVRYQGCCLLFPRTSCSRCWRRWATCS